MNLSTVLTQSAGTDPDRVALRLGSVTVSYAELDQAAGRVATLLTDRGVQPGDRVVVMLPNVTEFPVIYYGILRVGAVVVPMNPLLKAREVAYYLADSGARVIFTSAAAIEEAGRGAAEVPGADCIAVDDALRARLAGLAPTLTVVDRTGDDTAVILYTSGTTGKPKGAELTHHNLSSNVEVAREDLLELTPDDVVFGGLPLFHSFGQNVGLNATISAGASLVLLPRFDAGEALQVMSERGVTVFAGVPTMYSALLTAAETPGDLRLRRCISGGAALPVEVLNRFEERFGVPILEGYGLSETSPVASFNQPDARRAGSIGTPIRGVEMAIVDEERKALGDGEIGEIAIRGHNVMKGYWGKPEATDEALSADGWFRTGDVGRRDEEGFYYVVDRKKELIIRGGFNIYPREIEEVLYEHPAVAEAAVIGIPHAELGEEVAAAVALRPGATSTPQELRDHVKALVAPYKYPRMVWVVEALPKGPTGKILKREITTPAESDATN